MIDSSIYDEDYFINGKKSGKSLYENYRWMPELTLPMCDAIVNHCRIERQDRILDFGCARGYIVKALRCMNHDAYGCDISEWVINNCDEEVRPYLTKIVNGLSLQGNYDWIIAKDVLEHVEYVDRVINNLINITTKGLFVVLPLSYFNGGRYVVPEYEKDITHTQRFNLLGWAEKFVRDGWSVEVSYRVEGIKDNYFKPGWELGNGFITCRRVVE